MAWQPPEESFDDTKKSQWSPPEESFDDTKKPQWSPPEESFDDSPTKIEDLNQLKELKSKGFPLSEKQERIIWNEEDKKPITQVASEFAGAAANNLLPLIGKLGAGAGEIIEKGVLHPLGDQITFGVMNSPEVREKIWRDNDKVWRAAGAGAFGGFEELVEGATLLATESNVLTDKLQGLSDDERFRRYMFREATRKNLADSKSLTPDAAARMLSENPILKGITHTAARIEGATPEEAKLIVAEQMEQIKQSGLTPEELKEFENSVLVGDVASPFNIPGLGVAGRFTGKLVSKATKPIVQRTAALGFKGLEKTAEATEFAANKVLQGAELTQDIAKKIGEYTVNDQDTWIKGTVNTANLTYVPPAKLIRGTARVVKDIARQADIGGTAGRRGMAERAGGNILSSDETKNIFGPQGKGGVARAKIADWMVRQSNAIVQPGVEAGALNVLLGLPFIETAEQAGESFSTGLAIGGIGGSRVMERVGGLVDPRTTMAQKITNLVTPDPTAYRRDEDADIKRFLANATPELQQQMTDLADIEKRKAAVDAKIANLIQERDAQINPEDAAFRQKQIDGFIKQKEALAKSTPETQAEALRQIQLAFADSMELAQATGATAGLRGVNVVVLDSNNADQFFRNLYGDSLRQAETTVNLLTGIPSLTETDSQKLTEARQLLQKFQNDVAGAQSTRGFAIQEDNTDPNSENFVPPHLRRMNQNGATAVINADLVKHLTSQGFNIRHTLQHEVQHAMQQFKEVQDMLRPIRGQLFDQKIKNDDGSTEVYQQGIFSDEDIDRHATQYAKMMSPSDNGASFYEQFGGDVEKMRAYVKDEILAEIAATTGEYAGGTRASLDDVGRSVVDWLEVKTKSGRLKQLKETLRKGGIIFDNVGGYSALLGAKFTPETLAMVRQYQKGLKDFDGTMTVQQSRESDEPDIPLTKVLGSVALQNKYRHADFFEKEQIIKATAPDGSVTEIVVPAGAKIDPFVDVYRTQGGQLVDADGNVVTLGPEITFGSMPDGTTFETDTRIARKSNGSPIILTNREMKSRALERTKMIQNAIDSAKNDGSGVRLSDTGNGNYRGVMSPAQIEAFMALPNHIVSPNLKRMTKFFNELMARNDGTRVVMEYQASLLNGRYKALSPKIRDEVPIGFQLTKDGNFALTTISVSRLYDKMQAWADKKPENLQPWNGDTGAFWDSLIKLLDNHSRGEKGETGLHPDAYIAGKMKNKINDLFNAYNAETKQSNPDRSTLPRARGKDNLDIVIRSRRLDRINNFSESPSQKLPINYGYLTTNYMPAVNPMAAPMTAEEVQNRFDGSVTATRVRRAMATGEVDALESELRQMDDLLPTESLQLVQAEGEMPRIQIVSMFDPENVASLEPEEIVSDIDAETEAELAILDAQDGTVPPQDIAKVLSAKLDQLYADGGRSPIIPALETELEKIYQQLESQAQEQAAATEEIVEAPETTEVDMMNSPQDLILTAVDNYNEGRVDNATQTLPEYIRGVVNEAGALQIPPDVTDEQIMAAANDAMQSRDSLKQRIQGGTQFMPAGEIEAPSGERGFQSKLQMEIQRNFKGAKATPQQLKAVITNPQNVKQEEVKWSGVLDAIDRLAGENNGKVPVAELMDYLRNEGQVKFEEVTLGEDASVKDIADTYRIKIEDQYGEAAFYDEFDDPLEFDELPFALQNAIDNASKLPAPKYAKYQLSGGENYREVVMAMPKSKEFLTKSELDEYQKLRFETETRTPQQQARLNQLLIRISENNAASRDDKSYTSSHFPNVQNYVAHMRLNDRTDAEGKKGRFIEEFQSDLHQAGREEGYKDNEAKQKLEIAKNAKRNFIDNVIKPTYGTPPLATDSEYKQDAYRSKWSDEHLSEFNRLNDNVLIASDNIGGIADAPFRKDWPLQLFKRALRDAVESGKQWIGWTTGIEQVKRYENQFRQAVDEITWNQPKGDPRKNFAATKNGRTVITGLIKDDGSVYDSTISDANGKQLSEVVGKEIAAKILSEDSGAAKGNDLTVGGEGMKGFYDTILPKEIGKYVAKMGGKVEKSEIVIEKPSTFTKFTRTPNSVPEIINVREKTAPIWRVNITPEMANVVRAGQLQFMPSVAVVPERFTGTGEKGEERRGRYVAPPEFWTKFDIDEFERGGKFFDLETGEDVTDKTYGTGTIDVTGRRPSLVSESSIDEMPVEKGRTWKTNLFRKSAGWKWISENPPEIASIGSKEKPDPVLISVEASGGDHFYALKTEFPNGVQLARYPDQGNEPRLRPTRKGKIQLGDEVGRIRTSSGKEHPVYDTITIGQPKFMPAGESDAEYLNLAKDPEANQEQLQRMVDQAAKKAGYNVEPMYHGTDADFTVFNINYSGGREWGAGALGDGFYFTPNYDIAKEAADIQGKNGKVLKTYLKYKNPATNEVLSTKQIQKIISDPDKIRNLPEFLKQKGYDAIVEDFDGMQQVVVTDPSQIKSADPVTYDDEGNVIPLSQRFQTTSPDIRFMPAVDFNNLPEEAKKDAIIQDYDKGYNFVLKTIGENEILEILQEKGIGDEDIALWKSTKHYKNLKKDIQKNGIKIPPLGYEGIHRMLIALDLGIVIPYYEPVLKKQNNVSFMPAGEGLPLSETAIPDAIAKGTGEFAVLRQALQGVEAPVREPVKTPEVPKQEIPVTKAEDTEEEVADTELVSTGIDVPEYVDEISVISNAIKIANSQPWKKGRDFKLDIQGKVRAAAEKAGVQISKRTAEAIEYLVRVGLKDGLIALEQNPNAIGWYDEKTKQALGVMSLLFPEIAKDENARFAFTWALAVTSNGLKVDKNFELAERVYSAYRKTGKMPNNIQAGQAQKAINKSLDLFNQLTKEWGIDNTRKFMQTDFTVGEISRLGVVSKADKKEVKPGGEFADTIVRGSAILGPKIGNGFFSNLYGLFDALTMDRWLVRTWGRWTGTLVELNPELTQISKARLEETLAKLTPEDKARMDEMIGKDISQMTTEDLSLAIQKASMKPELREVMNTTETGEEFRKAGNSLAKYLDGQKEAPANPAERNFIREIFGLMLDELKANPKYKDLTMADLQAVLWYAEKRLYETAKVKADQDDVDSSDTDGYEDDEAPDYANAAIGVARKQGVSENRINKVLQKIKNERATTTRLADEGRGGIETEQQKGAGGFIGKEKREFRQYVAVTTAKRNRVGNEKVLWTYARKSGSDGGDTGVLKPRSKKNLGVKYISEWKPGRKLATMFRNNELPVVKFLELDSTDKPSAQKFADTLRQSKEESPYGAAVYVYETKDYQDMKLFMSESGKSGFAVKPDGDIVSVFSMDKGSGRSIMEAAIAAGGKKLDAFDTILPKFYGTHGFVEAARIPWNEEMAKETMPDWDKQTFQEYNNGEPDVVMMVLDPKFEGDYSPRTDIYATDYDQAVAMQSSLLKKIDKASKKK